MRYFIEFSYNGKNYHGWQNQPHSVSVQEVMEKCLTALLRTKIEIVGAGRTDSGVHALQMFAHFDAEKTIDNQLVNKLNSFLPKDIAVHQIHKVRDGAHARFDAIKRTYEYRISTYKDAFRYESSMYINLPLDVQKMQEATNILFKYTDFQCFSKSNTDVRTYNCKIYQAFWRQEGGLLIFTISADRFLRNMVRAIVGTLIDVGLNKISVVDFQNIIESKNRSKAGASVPACGLFLKKVEYSEDIFVKND
ncbi:tRNA pseudouridine synthase A [Capnocytophaga cynodegmi]|uniref:tRNA pseudouridine(38-40) synthase TruA n=1 Tax=Capnocytophaga cynodegmi TaxID=28189 RepID=UPI001EE33E25|nr:tRNA pseudouridine(38-40) synthase TruA [Capnocytophaga cynodegmi]GJQ06559.1 tRNA pseudouridine synthase A [Capnocytophaga cynodegmi]